MKKILISFAVGLALFAASAAQADAQSTVHYQSTFTDEDQKNWSLWANDNKTQRVKFVPKAGQVKAALKLTMEGTDWNTAIVTLPNPIKITPKTVVRFNLNCAGVEGINIGSPTTGARYFIRITHPGSDDSFTVQSYLANAVYKSGGKNRNTANDVMTIVGNDISSIQISTKGPNVWMSDFQIFEAEQAVPELPTAPAILEGNYQLQNYPLLNTFFPYGVIYHGIADEISGRHFAQTHLERYDIALDDIKRHHMNTFANFVDGSDIDERFKLAKKYNLRVFETKYAGVNLAASPGASDLIKKFSGHESLLAWYGDDEPTPNRYKDWVDNKLFINAIDKEHPVASAFSGLDAAKALGPYSEVVIVDPYSVQDSAKTLDNLLWHANYLRAAKRYAAGKKVWFIAQAYGDRQAMRYSTPEEARFEVFNALSAGVDGIIFFIHSDVPSYLEANYSREKFDDTLIDPWFNGNATYDELARLGRDVIPVMPSLMEKTEIADEGFSYEKERIVFQAFKAEPGKLIVVANKSLDSSYDGKIQVDLERGQSIYDLAKLEQIRGRSIPLSLAAGDGGLYIVARSAAWQSLRKEVIARKLKMELELLELDIQTLKLAKFNTKGTNKIVADAKKAMKRGDLVGLEKNIKKAKTSFTDVEKSNAAYVRQKQTLLEIRQSFGAVHAGILTRAAKLDGTTDPEWQELFGQLRQYSRQYFDLKRQFQVGDFKFENESLALKYHVQEFQKEVAKRVALVR